MAEQWEGIPEALRPFVMELDQRREELLRLLAPLRDDHLLWSPGTPYPSVAALVMDVLNYEFHNLVRVEVAFGEREIGLERSFPGAQLKWLLTFLLRRLTEWEREALQRWLHHPRPPELYRKPEDFVWAFRDALAYYRTRWGEIQEALERVRKASLLPRNSWVALRQGLQRLSPQELEEALGPLLQHPRPEVRRSIAWGLAHLRPLPEAALYRLLSPEEATEFLLERFRFLKEQGHRSEAQRLLEILARQTEGMPSLRSQVALAQIAWEAEEEPASALEALEALEATFQEGIPAEVRASAAWLRIEILQRLLRLEEAHQQAQRLAEEFPGTPWQERAQALMARLAGEGG